MPQTGEVTDLLVAWNAGDEGARDALMSLIYDELRRLAQRHMRRERPGHTLQTTALVNEAYIRLAGQRDVEWKTRAHFFAIAAQMMRRVLVDHARRRGVDKRGGGAIRVSLEEAMHVAAERDTEVIALDVALERLAALDARQSRIVEMRYFAGLTIEEVAAVLDLSSATVKREWSSARAWLAREMRNEP